MDERIDGIGSPVSRSDFATPFLLASREGTVVAGGIDGELSCVSRADLPACARRLLDRPGRGGSVFPMIVGALPFSSSEPVRLYRPEWIKRSGGGLANLLSPLSGPPEFERCWQVESEPSRSEYARRVREALRRIAGSEDDEAALRKVVLGRRLVLHADRPIDVGAVLRRLSADPAATTFAVPLTGDHRRGRRVLVGASPELLIAKSGCTVRSEPMAGSARRSRDHRADRAAAERLLRSEKDLREHASVVEWVADRLAPYCRSLSVPTKPELRSTSTMWHLVSPVEGVLADDDVSSLELATALHPTPAVCGVPRDAAAQAIAELEPFDRGFFTGAVGWSDTSGDGRWLVTIRCAEISGSVASLYAGAGIVAGSDPEAEAAETSAKFATLLRALEAPEEDLAR
jgi:isochorismate synthase